MFLPPNVGHFHTKESPSSLRTPAECPLLQFTSETTPSWHQPSREGPSPQDWPHLTNNHRQGPRSPPLLSNLLQTQGPRAPTTQNSGNMGLLCCSSRGEQPEGEQDLGDPHVQKLLSLWILGCNTLPTVGSPTQKPSPFCREVPSGRTEKPWPLGSSGGWGSKANLLTSRWVPQATSPTSLA